MISARTALVALLLSTAAFRADAQTAPAAAPSPAATPATAGGVDVAGLDRSVAPGDDFDAYANGGWRKTTEIPADRSSLGSFVTVQMEVEKRNTALFAGLAKGNAAPGTDERRIADYYAAYLDSAGIEARGTKPLEPVFADLDKVQDRRSLAFALGRSLRADTDPLNATNFWTENLFGVFVAQALQDPNRNVAYLLQGGIGMPDREYYLSDAAAMQAPRAAYRKYLADLAGLLGWQDAAARAAAVYALEEKIARAHVAAEDAQDAKKAEEWKTADYAAKAPGIEWAAFFDGAGLKGQKSVIAWHPAPTVALAKLAGSEPVAVWRDYLKLHAASLQTSVLPKAFDDLRFGFYGKVLAGQQQQRPRDKRAIAATGAIPGLGDAVSKAYVARHFPERARADIGVMVDNIKAAFDRRLTALDWMAPATKAEARKKLSTVIVEIGHPTNWRDDATLEVKRDDAFGNAYRAKQYEYRHQLAKLGKPVNRHEWWLLPHQVNAVFLPLQNAMNYPAAILEPPFYDLNADAAFNYGSLGSVIGHEITHSFDNLGSDFDAEGRVRNWWTSADFARFKTEGEALIRQYDAYQAFPDLKLNGTLTLGENIADVAGLAAAYSAYHASLGGKPAPVIGGLTGDQRFFLAYAQSRRAKFRDATLRNLIATDGHAPGPWRAQTVRNVDGWYEAFGVKPGQGLYLEPGKRIKVW